MEITSFKTFAFIDLETNGLLGLDPTRTKITQLSIIACSVKHILELDDLKTTPRIQHKLSLCLNPRKLIKLDCSDITGLTNELLEKERKFDENTVDLITNFLSHLQQPVCLVAHNGNKFDYPLLKSHLKLLNKAFPESLICCDSLVIFKKIDEIFEQNSKTLINGYKLTSWEKISTQELLMIDAEILEVQELAKCYESDEEIKTAASMTISQLESDFINNRVDRIKKEQIEEVDDLKFIQFLNETTPNKPVKIEEKNPRTKQSEATKLTSKGSKRQLFPEINGSAAPVMSKNGKKIYPKGYYTLRGIYKRFFDEFPEQSHDSEEDVKALLKCVCACKKEFLHVAMETASNFCDLKSR